MSLLQSIENARARIAETQKRSAALNNCRSQLTRAFSALIAALRSHGLQASLRTGGDGLEITIDGVKADVWISVRRDGHIDVCRIGGTVIDTYDPLTFEKSSDANALVARWVAASLDRTP